MTKTATNSKPAPRKRRPKSDGDVVEAVATTVTKATATNSKPDQAMVQESVTDFAPDPFDPESLRLKDATSFGVQRVLTVVPVRRPNKQEFVRVHPDPSYRLTTAVLTDENDRDAVYLISPGLRGQLVGEITPVNLLTAVTRHGDPFLWQLKVATDGRSNPWHESANTAAELAVTKWIRMSSNMSARCYDVAVATGPLPDPEWPDLTFRQLLELAFKGRFIDSHNHAILRSLRGEV